MLTLYVLSRLLLAANALDGVCRLHNATMATSRLFFTLFIELCNKVSGDLPSYLPNVDLEQGAQFTRMFA